MRDSRFAKLSSENQNKVIEALIENLWTHTEMRNELYDKFGVIYSKIECPYKYFIDAENIDDILECLESSADHILSGECCLTFPNLSIAPDSYVDTRT